MTTSLVHAGEVSCLAKNIYFEARSESLAGKIAVAMVVLNRVSNPKWPSTICEVIWQKYQFSWTNDGLSDNPKNMSAWEDAQYIAKLSIELYKVKDSTHYHTVEVWPNWADGTKINTLINKHIFYSNIK